MRNYFLLLIIFIFLVGCASNYVVINPIYRDKDMTKNTLTILPIPKDGINVMNKKDVVDDFKYETRNPEIVIQDSLYNFICQETENKITNIRFVNCDLGFSQIESKEIKSKFFTFSERIGKDSIRFDFAVPKIEYLKELGVETDVVVFIDNIVFDRNLTSGGPGVMYVPGPTISTPGGNFTGAGMWVGGGSSTSYLGAKVKFIIWDYSKNKPISYGETDVRTSLLFGMNKSTWITNFRSVARNIFKKSPFKFYYEVDS